MLAQPTLRHATFLQLHMHSLQLSASHAAAARVWALPVKADREQGCSTQHLDSVTSACFRAALVDACYQQHA
jgi:hypothetical protein